MYFHTILPSSPALQYEIGRHLYGLAGNQIACPRVFGSIFLLHDDIDSGPGSELV